MTSVGLLCAESPPVGPHPSEVYVVDSEALYLNPSEICCVYSADNVYMMVTCRFRMRILTGGINCCILLSSNRPSKLQVVSF